MGHRGYMMDLWNFTDGIYDAIVSCMRGWNWTLQRIIVHQQGHIFAPQIQLCLILLWKNAFHPRIHPSISVLGWSAKRHVGEPYFNPWGKCWERCGAYQGIFQYFGGMTGEVWVDTRHRIASFRLRNSWQYGGRPGQRRQLGRDMMSQSLPPEAIIVTRATELYSLEFIYNSRTLAPTWRVANLHKHHVGGISDLMTPPCPHGEGQWGEL